MLTVAGTGMSEYNTSLIEGLVDFYDFDYIVLDKNYLIANRNPTLNTLSPMLMSDSFDKQKLFIRDKLAEGMSILYIVSGSPYFFSGASVVIKYLSSCLTSFNLHKDLLIINNLSCKDYLINKLMISEQDIYSLSLHGRANIDLTNFMTKPYTFILSDSETLSKVRDIIKYIDKRDINIIMASKLGYSSERILSITDIDLFLSGHSISDFEPYVLLLKKQFKDNPSYSDSKDFEQDKGMITKNFKRNLTIQELELKSNLVLWDVGAGSGSVGIEAYKRFRVRTVFFERDKKRLSDIKKNLNNNKVMGARLVSGNVIHSHKDELELPDRIFIGGGGELIAKNVNLFYNKLKPSGLIIANYVSLKDFITMINSLMTYNIPFSIRSISLTTFKNNDLLFSEPERLVFQITIKKDKDYDQ